jgi:hypothetical protein
VGSVLSVVIFSFYEPVMIGKMAAQRNLPAPPPAHTLAELYLASCPPFPEDSMQLTQQEFSLDL